MRALVLVALIGAAAPAHADVIVVAQSGGGDFTNIQDAYVASQVGDTILIRSGTYSGSVVTIDHALAIVAEPADDVIVTSLLQVIGLPENEAVVISGIDELVWFRIIDSGGDIRLQEIGVLGSNAPGLFLDGARSVVVERCTLQGRDGYDGAGAGFAGGSALIATGGSSVALYDCELRAGDGGDGLSSFACIAFGGAGATAAKVEEGSELYAMGSQFYGGDGGDGTCGGTDGPPGHALAVDDSSSAIVTNVILIPGSGGIATSGNAIVDLGIDRRGLVAPTLVREGETVTWRIFGRPGDMVYLPASLRPKWRYLAAALGVQTFGFPLLAPLELVGVIGQGSTMTLQVPSQTLAPGEESRTTFHQVFVLDSSGQRILGGGHAVVTIDDTF